jgi:hypothetical protein
MTLPDQTEGSRAAQAPRRILASSPDCFKLNVVNAAQKDLRSIVIDLVESLEKRILGSTEFVTLLGVFHEALERGDEIRSEFGHVAITGNGCRVGHDEV